MAEELLEEESDLSGEDLRYIAEAQRIRAAMDRSAAIAAKQQQEAADRADREAAQMEAAQLIKDGATPQEVTRMLGHRLYRGATPRTQFEALKFATPPAQPQPPVLTNYNGQTFLLRQPGGMVPQRVIPPPAEKPAAMPPDVKQNLLMQNRDIAAQQKALGKARDDAATVEQKGALLDRMTALDRAKEKALQTSTNYPGYTPPKAASESTPKVSTKSEFDALPKGAIYTGRDGRLYKKP